MWISHLEECLDESPWITRSNNFEVVGVSGSRRIILLCVLHYNKNGYCKTWQIKALPNKLSPSPISQSLADPKAYPEGEAVAME